jgi:hypothetical protein
VSVVVPRTGVESSATVVDISLAGAGLETEESLLPGEHLTLSFTTPTLWDPLVVPAVVAWSEPPRPREAGAPLGRSRPVARSGVSFEYGDADVVLAVYEMLATLGYE